MLVGDFMQVVGRNYIIKICITVAVKFHCYFVLINFFDLFYSGTCNSLFFCCTLSLNFVDFSKRDDMNHNRFLFVILSSFLFCAVTPQLSFAAEDFAQAMEKDISSIAVKEGESVEEGALESLQNELRTALKSDNPAQAVEQIMKDNAEKFTFPETMQSRVASAQEAAEQAVAKEGASTDRALENVDTGGEPETPEEPTTPTSTTPKTNPLLDGVDTTNPEAARAQFSKVAETKNLVQNVEGRLNTVVSDAKSSMEEYATRVQSADRDIAGFAKKYTTDLSNIPDNALNSLGKTDEEISELKENLASSDPEKVKAAALEVAKLKALSRVGDLDGVISNAAKSGADDTLATGMKESAVTNINKAFDDLSEAMKEPDFFEKTVTQGADGAEIATSKMQQFLDSTESSLTESVENSATDAIGQCDSAATQLAKDGGISTFEQLRMKASAALRSPLTVLKESVADFATTLKTTSRYDVADGFVDAGTSIKDGAVSLGTELLGAAKMLVSAVVFMVPNIFQSAFLAQKQKAAAMVSWANPIKYGGRVYQIPDSCINLNDPESSWPIYVQIPVNNPTDTISQAISTMYNGYISGPTTDNSMSAAIHSASAQIFSFGTNSDTTINRYKIDEPHFIPMTDVTVVYGGPGAYVTTGSIPMNSSQFTGQIVSLRTGQVTDATGEDVNATGLDSAKSVPLIDVAQWGALQLPQTAPVSQGLQALIDTLPSILAKEEVAGTKQTYTQYSDVGSGSGGTQLTTNMHDLLDTDCVNPDGSLSNSNCSAVIVSGLEALSAGLTLSSSGAVGTVFHLDTTNPQQFLNITKSQTPVVAAAGSIDKIAPGAGAKTTPIVATGNTSNVLGRLSPKATRLTTTSAKATTTTTSAGWSGLGAVIPVFGWGGPNDVTPLYSTIINQTNFPGFDATQVQGVSAVAEIGKIGQDNTVQHTAVSSDIGDEAMQFASQQELWAAKGCWMYLSTNTPFVEYITQGITAPLSLQGSYVDYIVFLDETINVVPMMVPVTVDVQYTDDDGSAASYKKVQMYFNPAIKYWASLIGYNLEQFMQPDTTGTAQPVMYDLEGNVYPYAALANAIYVPAGQGSGAGGFLGTISGTSQSGPGFPDIYNQFQIHSSALIARASSMPIPYQNCSISPDAQHNVVISQAGAKGAKATTTTINSYTGMNCFASSEKDLLLAVNVYPLTQSGLAFLSLPNSQAKYLVSLITDIAYELQDDNSWQPVDFTNSILTLGKNKQPVKNAQGMYQVDAKNKNRFYFLSGIYGSATIPPALQQYITAQRNAWIDNIGSGAGLGNLNCSLASGLSQKYVQASKAFIYEINPSPSRNMTNQKDYFVIVNSQNPSLSSLKPIEMSQANSSCLLVSLLTGYLYDITGNPAIQSSGVQKKLNTGTLASNMTVSQQIYNTVTQTLFKNLPSSFTTPYAASVKQYNAQQVLPMGPYPFGSIQVAIRSGDAQSGTLVYYNAAGMHQANFVPRDLYVILTPNADNNGYNISSYNPKQQQFLLSLITGIAYDQHGQIAMTLPAANLTKLLQGWQSGWSSWIKTTLQTLQKSYAQREAAYAADQQKVEDGLNDFMSQNDAALNKDQATISAIIKRLKPAGEGLPIPYSGLQYDSVSGNYVHPSPASATDTSSLIYLFLGTGNVYQADGTYVSQYQPAHLKAVCDQYGVIVDATGGTQKLGIPMMQPSLLMTDGDDDITATTSGETLINTASPNYLGEKITVPTGYGMFFSTLMDTYYVYDNALQQWMSVDGGHRYEKDGAPVVEGNSVAVASSAKTKGKKGSTASTEDQFILLYENENGFMQGYMSDGSQYSNTSHSNSPATWIGLSAPYNQLSVTANTALTQFVVNDTTYVVNSDYAWHSLVLVPIDETGALLTTMPNSSYQYIEIVTEQQDLLYVIFNGVTYKVSSLQGTEYTMTPITTASGSAATSIVVTTNLYDSDTTAPYITIEDGKTQYYYGYVPVSFDPAQQEANRVNIWKGATAASPLPIQFGPMHTASKQIADKTVTAQQPDYVSYVLFAQDLPAKSNVVIAPTAVNIKSVTSLPSQKTDPTEYALVEMSIGNVFKTKDGRFVCKVGGSSSTNSPGMMSFSYVSSPAYVDLQTAALYDQSTGLSLGQCLNMHDFLYALDQCRVMVTTNSKGVAQLTYRSAARVASQAQQIETAAKS